MGSFWTDRLPARFLRKGVGKRKATRTSGAVLGACEARQMRGVQKDIATQMAVFWPWLQ